MPDDFYAPAGNSSLRQCEIVSGIRQTVPAPGAAWSDSLEVEIIDHPWVIVLSQDCDLEQDYHARFVEVDVRLQIPSILFCEVFLANEKKQEPKMSNIWKQLTQNNLERYQYLAAIAAAEDASSEGFGPVVIDFKRYFALPTLDVYKQIELGAKRRTILSSPYLEQVSTRFCYYQYRIALPMPHLARTAPAI